jgi:hypothetical protein
LLVTDEAVLSGIRVEPGGVNIVQDRRGIGGNAEAIRPLVGQQRIDIGIDLINRKGEAVQMAFWANVLRMHTDPRMSATQVLTLSQKAQELMAPMLGRLQLESVAPMVKRTFGIMARRKMFPPVPRILAGVPIRVVHVSPIARAQRATGADAVMRLAQAAGLLAQLTQSQEPLDNLDTDEMVRIVHEANEAPQRVLKDVREVQLQRVARAQIAQQEEALGVAGQGADILQKIGGAVGDVAPALQAA